MPYRFPSIACPGVELYIGFDKYENEDLIRFAWPGDIWFHVDKHSSAHVYVRPPRGSGISFDSLPPALIREAAQLTKENSIEGCKLSNVTVIYTPASNLRKDGTMDTGTVGFHKEKLVRRTVVPEKDRELLKTLMKRRVEDRTTDLRKSLDEHMREVRREERRQQAAQEEADKAERERLEAQRKARSYDELWGPKGQAQEAEREWEQAGMAGLAGPDGAQAGAGADPFDDFI